MAYECFELHFLAQQSPGLGRSKACRWPSASRALVDFGGEEPRLDYFNVSAWKLCKKPRVMT